MGVTDRLQNAWAALTRSDPILSIDEWIGQFGYLGNQYTYAVQTQQSLLGHVEEIESSFYGYVTGAYKANAVVFACMLTRLMLFSEARFQFRELRDGRPGDLFGGTDGRNPGNRDLALLSHPWPNATTGDLLARAIQDADLAGNFYAVRRGDRIRRLRPDWVTIVLGSDGNPAADVRDIDAEVIGYLYHPGGRHSGLEPVAMFADQVAHFAPIPDPLAGYRGMSWITPIVREVMADGAATDHKLKFFENGATPNMVVKRNDTIAPQEFQSWVKMMREGSEGLANAYRTLYLTAGADATLVGTNLQQQDFKVTQGAGETRIAAAAGVHPAVVGLSEGMQGSSLNAGNFGAAMRITADRTMRPLWRNFAGSMSTIISVPAGAELWYDDRDVPFLKEDVKDAAAVLAEQFKAISTGVTSGFEPDAVVEAVMAGDPSRLKGNHTGLYSVQLQPPGTTAPEPTPLITPSNGKVPATTEGK